MKLTRDLRIRPDNKSNNSNNNNDSDKFPTLQLFLLAICRVSEPIALTSCFPYAYAMVHDFHVGDRTTASFYTGIFISAFALAESLTGFFWGGLSDRIGRRPVLLTGCLGTLASLIFVGLSSSFWMALAGRAIGGLLNGNVGIIQTMVGETVKRKEHEPRAYAVMPFVWSIGTIIGPAIGGMLAKPSESMPSIFPPSSIFARFPYLLPNLVCAILLLLSAAFGYLLLAETHPDMQGSKYEASGEPHYNAAETPLITTGGAMADPGVDLRAETYGTFNTVDVMEEKQWLVDSEGRSRPPSVSSDGEDKVITYKIAMIVVALSIFTYHSMTFDQLLPIFLQDERIDPEPPITPFSIPGGLGYSTQDVGVIMSVNGAIALAIQGIVFPIVTAWLGIWKTFVTVTILHPLSYLIVPYLAFLPANTNTLTTGVYVCLTIRNLTSILAYPLILIILKEAVVCPSNLGRVNGLAASAGAASRTLAPPLAGYLYGIGTSIGFTGLAWWGSALVAVAGAFQLFTLKRTRNKTAIIQPAAACLARALPERPRDIVRIVVHETDHV